jgi:pimeloyl-CoA synthetase
MKIESISHTTQELINKILTNESSTDEIKIRELNSYFSSIKEQISKDQNLKIGEIYLYFQVRIIRTNFQNYKI